MTTTDAEAIRAHARALAADAPPLSDEQRHRLRALLRPEPEVPAPRQRSA